MLLKKTISFFLFLIGAIKIFALEKPRFPMPEFDNGHVPPITQTPMPRGIFFEYIDVFILLAMLSLITYFVIKKRSRTGILLTSIASILYFGFYKHGCVCPIGSIQNVTLALFDNSYVIPISIILIFTLPLLFSLFFGRIFCSGICFFGALQDLVIFKQVKISPWVQKALGVIPYLYLGLAILFAATDSDFIICKYDPFIGFFRMSASFHMFIIGVLILVLGIFISRPYCRFLCPYGVLLNWFSRISKWHLSITPSECVMCNLCENSCPVDAIPKPVAKVKVEQNQKGSKRLMLIIILIPVMIFSSGFLVSRLHKPLSMMNSSVALAEEIVKEAKTGIKSVSMEATTFNSSGIPATELYKDAEKIRSQFLIGTWILGAFLGLILGIALFNLSVFKRHSIYEPDRGACVSCGRCFKYCPVGKEIST